MSKPKQFSAGIDPCDNNNEVSVFEEIEFEEIDTLPALNLLKTKYYSSQPPPEKQYSFWQEWLDKKA
jgi:hypothetical protein